MNSRKSLRYWGILLVIIIAITFIQLPYYVSTPGLAKKLSPIIEVEGGYKDANSSGDFMLTTIRIGRANLFEYIWAHFNDYHLIYELDEIRPSGESDEEYRQRQLHMMDTSKEAATYVAYKHAGKEVTLTSKGVYIVQVFDNMPAAGKLKSWDKIISIDNNDILYSDQLIQYLANKKLNDIVTLKVERNKKTIELEITLDKYIDAERVGLGIQLADNLVVQANPPVHIDTNQIGGPSAGLMFSLEIYNQLVEEDITKGYRIAGTGEIDLDGNVGRIGGIDRKIVAAHKAGADIFLAPNEGGKEGSNYEEALATAKDINTKMQIVPVDTFYDALRFLESLEEKK